VIAVIRLLRVVVAAGRGERRHALPDGVHVESVESGGQVVRHGANEHLALRVILGEFDHAHELPGLVTKQDMTVACIRLISRIRSRRVAESQRAKDQGTPQQPHVGAVDDELPACARRRRA